MDAQPRHDARTLTRAAVPPQRGVYAWYRERSPVYVGKAAGREGLRQRLWSAHMSTRVKAIRKSAFRRNVAQHLAISTANEIKTGRYVPTESEIDAVNAWIRGCRVAWIVTEDAVSLEDAMKREWMPPLTKV
jgi:hypothetical protein